MPYSSIFGTDEYEQCALGPSPKNFRLETSQYFTIKFRGENC